MKQQQTSLVCCCTVARTGWFGRSCWTGRQASLSRRWEHSCFWKGDACFWQGWVGQTSPPPKKAISACFFCFSHQIQRFWMKFIRCFFLTAWCNLPTARRFYSIPASGGAGLVRHFGTGENIVLHLQFFGKKASWSFFWLLGKTCHFQNFGIAKLGSQRFFLKNQYSRWMIIHGMISIQPLGVSFFQDAFAFGFGCFVLWLQLTENDIRGEVDEKNRGLLELRTKWDRYPSLKNDTVALAKSKKNMAPKRNCWWLKSYTTWDVWNPINNGINYQPQLVSRISAINRRSFTAGWVC